MNYLGEMGFELSESLCNYTAYLNDLHPKYDEKIIRVERGNYPLFRKLHSQSDSDMYWNSDRIYSALDNWVILVDQQNGQASGAIYYTSAGAGWYEIFGMDIEDGELSCGSFDRLLRAAICEAKKSGVHYMTYFCDEKEESAVQNAGFVRVRKYLSFRKVCLPEKKGECR